MTVSNESGFYIEAAEYYGHEEEIISIRNRNRSDSATKRYLDWRYIGKKSDKSPVIFFVKSTSGKNVGMASIIYREYCIRGKKTAVPILGDISIDAELRGKGIAKMLFLAINNYLDKENIPFAFVMPNIPARKSLCKENWRIGQEMVRYVFFLNPKAIFKEKMNSVLVGKTGDWASIFIRFFLSILHDKKLIMRAPSSFRKSNDEYWQRWREITEITKNRTLEYLNWRYLEHPYDAFHIYEFFKLEEFIGYIVAKFSDDGSIIIYEIVTGNQDDFDRMIKYFLFKCSYMKKVHSVRITLNRENPYRKALKKAFFVERPTPNVFQTYGLNHQLSELSWLITSGDKDV
jgi:GNAT superfamily N-acetyltransferase